MLLQDMGKYEGAGEVFKQTRFHYQNSSQPIEVARVECSLAHTYHLRVFFYSRCSFFFFFSNEDFFFLQQQANYQEAEQLYKSALERFKKEKGEDDLDVATTLNMLGAYKVIFSFFVCVSYFINIH
jgi:tetratricopeptide (TPR) repeat protein